MNGDSDSTNLPPQASTAAPEIHNEAFLRKISGAGWRPPTPAELTALMAEYEVLDLQRVTSTAAIYKARQIALDRLVLIKILPPEISREPEFAERFKREAKLLGQLKHPNIIALFNVGQTPKGHLFLVTENVDGSSLNELIRTRRLNPRLTLEIFTQLCEGLAAVHREGVVHRDIKPSNILVDSAGHPKVANFGLASSTSPKGGAGLTMRGVVIGTPDYMSPERLRGERVDQRTDIYSLGIMFYEALTGEVPRGSCAPASALTKLPPGIDPIIARAIDPDPAKRFQSTMEMKQAIDLFVNPGSAPAVAPPAPAPAAKAATKATAPSKLPRVLAIAAGLIIVAGGAAFFLIPKKPGAAGAGDPVVEEGSAVVQQDGATPRPLPPGAIDVMPTLDFVRDSANIARASAWSRVGSGVVGTSDAHATLVLPVDPSGDYEWTTRITRYASANEDVQWFIPAGRAGWFILACRDDELALVRGAARDSIKPNPLSRDAQHEVQIRVTGVHGSAPQCQVLVKGKQVASGAGTAANLTGAWDRPPERRPAIGIVTPSGGRIVLHALELRGLSGDKINPATTRSAPQVVKIPDDEVRFKSSRYRLVRSSIPWTQAKTEAELKGGHLATLTTPEEEEWARRTFGGELKQWNRIWVGAVQLGRDQPWQWVTDEPFQFAKWIPGEPNASRTPSMQPPFCGALSNSLTEPGSNGMDDTSPGGGSMVVGYLVEWDDRVPTPQPSAVAAAPAMSTPAPSMAAPPAIPSGNTPAPTPSAPKAMADTRVNPATAAMDVNQRLAAIQAQYDAAYERDVAKTSDVAMTDLRSRYETAIDREIAKLAQAGKVSETVALRDERARVGRGVPLAENEDATLPPALKPLRVAYRAAATKIAQDRDTRVKPLRDWQLRQLDALVVEFGKSDKTDWASIVKQRRDSLAAEWASQAPKGNAGALPAVASINTSNPAADSGVSSWRKAAQLALNFDGKLDIRSDGKRSAVSMEADLPTKRFDVVKLELINSAKNAKLTDADLAAIATCKELEEFKLERADVSSAGLEALRGLQSLKTVRIYFCKQVNDEVMPVIGTLPNLEVLELHFNGVTKEGLKHLTRATKLRRLSLHGRSYSAAALTQLATLPIEELSISEFPDPGALDVSGFKRLRSLTCVNMRDGKAKLMEQLSKLKGLDYLKLAACGLSDDDLAKLASLSVTNLDLEGATIRGAGLANLRSSRALSRLRLFNCNIADTTLEAIGRDVSGIQALTVAGTGSVQPASFRALGKCRNLKELNAGDGIGNDSVAAEIANLSGVQKVFLSGCPQLTSAGLQSLAKLKSLRHLAVRNCSKLTAADVDSLRKMRPDLHVEF